MKALIMLLLTISAQSVLADDLTPTGVYKGIKKIFDESHSSHSPLQEIKKNANAYYENIAVCSDKEEVFYFPFAVGIKNVAIGPFHQEYAYFDSVYEHKMVDPGTFVRLPDFHYKSKSEADRALQGAGNRFKQGNVSDQYVQKFKTYFWDDNAVQIEQLDWVAFLPNDLHMKVIQSENVNKYKFVFILREFKHGNGYFNKNVDHYCVF